MEIGWRFDGGETSSSSRRHPHTLVARLAADDAQVTNGARLDHAVLAATCRSRAASVRRRVPSLCSRLWMCVFTVGTETVSSAAISLLLSPRATSFSTSSSRSVSAEIPAATGRSAGCSAGRRACSSASTTSCAVAEVSSTSRQPWRLALSIGCGLSARPKTIVRTPACTAASATFQTPGRPPSIRITSGRCATTTRVASISLAATEMTANSGRAPTNDERSS
jgi:hypothetical protein